MKNAIVYIHGQGGSPEEAAHYQSLFPGMDVMGFAYTARFPWEAEEEFPPFFESVCRRYGRVFLIANSIGAYFAMASLPREAVSGAWFISPVVNMEKLIGDMMCWAKVTEEELREKGEIATAFGQTLSWKYLTYAREHPAVWQAPTHILYGGGDTLTSYETVRCFARQTGATLTVMEDGEHWFHTPEQLRFLDSWLESHPFSDGGQILP